MQYVNQYQEEEEEEDNCTYVSLDVLLQFINVKIIIIVLHLKLRKYLI